MDVVIGGNNMNDFYIVPKDLSFTAVEGNSLSAGILEGKCEDIGQLIG